MSVGKEAGGVSEGKGEAQTGFQLPSSWRLVLREKNGWGRVAS